jgi:hypothetical protein
MPGPVVTPRRRNLPKRPRPDAQPSLVPAVLVALARSGQQLGCQPIHRSFQPRLKRGILVCSKAYLASRTSVICNTGLRANLRKVDKLMHNTANSLSRKAAVAFAAISLLGAVLAAPANADRSKCSTDNDLYDSGYTTTCNVFTDDGGWTITTTHCDGKGNGTSD